MHFCITSLTLSQLAGIHSVVVVLLLCSLAGVSDSLIAAHGRWKSFTYRKYFDTNLHHILPTYRLLLHTRVFVAHACIHVCACVIIRFYTFIGLNINALYIYVYISLITIDFLSSLVAQQKSDELIPVSESD